MSSLVAYELKGIPTGQQAAFLESVRNSLIMTVREGLYSGISSGVLDVTAELEGNTIHVKIVDLKSKGSRQERDPAFFNDKTRDEFYNTVTEDDFMARVMTSAQRLTPQLYDMLVQAEKGFK